MGLALVEAAIAVGAHGLQEADEGKPAIKLLETRLVDPGQRGRGLQVLRLELIAEIEGQVRLGVEQQRGEVVGQRAAPSSLVIDEPRLTVAHHDVARLEIAVEKKVGGRPQQKIAQRVEIVFELLLVEGNVRELEKVVFEVVQVPAHGAPVEGAVRIAEAVVQSRPRLDLHLRQ